MRRLTLAAFCALASVPAAAQPGAGLQLSEGRLVLPAVPGRPAAAYFTLRNPTPHAIEIRHIRIEGASGAEMHTSKGGEMLALPKVVLAPGAQQVFEPGGAHVMVFGPPRLAPGQSVRIELFGPHGPPVRAKLRAVAPDQR